MADLGSQRFASSWVQFQLSIDNQFYSSFYKRAIKFAIGVIINSLFASNTHYCVVKDFNAIHQQGNMSSRWENSEQ